MRRAGFLVAGLSGIAALLLTGVDPADARPRIGPRTMFRALMGPLGIPGLYRLRPHYHVRRGQARRGAAAARAARQRAIAAGGLGAAALAGAASWSGPAFWPGAAGDMFGYAVRVPGSELRFWGDGFADVLAGIISQADERPAARGRTRNLAGTDDRGAGQDGAGTSCEPASSRIDEVVARLEQTVKPTPAQQAAFRDVRTAIVRAADDLARACPEETPLTPLARLAAMQHRLWAMQSAARAVRARLSDLAARLDDEQKARLDAASPPPQPTRHAGRRRPARAADAPPMPVQICHLRAQGASEWPIEEIRARVQPTEPQQASLLALAEASGNMAKLQVASCPQQPPAGALARIDAMLGRLDAMLYAVNVVEAPLRIFYGGLTDEQKARFNSLGAAAGS